jgi:hypothetical protein
VCYALLIINLFLTQVNGVANMFLVINLSLFAIIPLLINCIKNNYLKAGLSAISILIWSISIDIVCYYMFPKFVFGMSLPMYVYRGIVYNAKYVFYNALLVGAISLLEKVHYKILGKEREVVRN